MDSAERPSAAFAIPHGTDRGPEKRTPRKRLAKRRETPHAGQDAFYASCVLRLNPAAIFDVFLAVGVLMGSLFIPKHGSRFFVRDENPPFGGFFGLPLQFMPFIKIEIDIWRKVFYNS